MTKRPTILKKIPTDLRRYIKQNKSKLSIEIDKILTVKNNLTAFEISSFLFDVATNNNSSNYPDEIKKRMILNISKDFNVTLSKKLLQYNIERKKNTDGVFTYIKS